MPEALASEQPGICYVSMPFGKKLNPTTGEVIDFDNVCLLGIRPAVEAAGLQPCSKAHVHNAINGKVVGVSPLPAIHMGRRKLVRRSALERWKRANERASFDAMIPASPEVDAVGPEEEKLHA